MADMKIKARKYPGDFMMRYDDFTSDYCDIALEAYCDALQLYERMEAAEWKLGPVDHKMPNRMKRKTMIAIVFTAMCAEAFINDYLSVRLGDAKFKKYNKSDFHYYDKLKIIMSDILGQEDYAQFEWGQNIDKLFKRRNELVHNASKEMTAEHLVRTTKYEDKYWQLKVEAVNKLKTVQEEFPLDQEAQLHALLCVENPEDAWERTELTVADFTKRLYLKQELEFAQLGLTALSDMTRKIERLDPQSNAFKYTFSPMSLLWGEDDEMSIREKVFPMLGLHFTKEELERVVVARAKQGQIGL